MRAAALGMMVKGVGGFVFGSGEQTSEDDGGVEQLLETISDGTHAGDRRAAMETLHLLVDENPQAKLSFGAMGFPILMAVLRDERDDIELVKGALDTLLSALTVESSAQDEYGKLSPGILNAELLAREQNVVSLLLSLLDEEDFYVRYDVLQLLTTLLSVSPAQVQEEVLSTPQGVTRLMDMIMEREAIRNEALLLLTHLTRAAKEIQKIVVFEGAFERIFSIIKEEGGSDGGVVVQDCLELLNNLLRNNSSNQVFLRETLGLKHVVSLVGLQRRTDDQQKSVNLLCALETIALLLAPDGENVQPANDPNVVANQTVFAQDKNLLDNLLALGVEGRVSAAAVRCLALKCIGDFVNGHPNNRDRLTSKMLGQEPEAEPAIVCILRVLLHTPNLNECIAAEYVFKCFCEGNPEGQSILASTITPSPQSSKASFGSMLVQALVGIDGRNDLEASCRAASVLSHILKDNVHCKERVLRIDLEMRATNHSTPDYLLPRCMRYLLTASTSRNFAQDDVATQWLQPVLLRLLVTWLADCPPAVSAFLDTPTHVPFLIELISSSGNSTSVHVAGLAAVLLGECIVYNDAKPSTSNCRDASAVLEALNQRIGLTVFFSKWEEMRQSSLFVSAASSSSRLPKPLTRSNAASVAAGDGFIASDVKDKHQQVQGDLISSTDTESPSAEPAVTLFYDAPFVQFINKLEPLVRDRIVELFTNPRSAGAIEVASFEPHQGESSDEFVARLKSLLHTQAKEIQELLARNSVLAEDLLLNSSEGGKIEDSSTHRGSAALKAEVERLKHQLAEAERRTSSDANDRLALESEVASYRQLASSNEAELQSLSDAYNALEKVNYRLAGEIESLRAVVEGKGVSLEASKEQLEAAREEGRLAAQKESEAELGDLFVCLGQEESKVERLRSRLEELGQDVDALLVGIGDNEAEGNANDASDDDDDEEEEE